MTMWSVPSLSPADRRGRAIYGTGRWGLVRRARFGRSITFSVTLARAAPRIVSNGRKDPHTRVVQALLVAVSPPALDRPPERGHSLPRGVEMKRLAPAGFFAGIVCYWSFPPRPRAQTEVTRPG